MREHSYQQNKKCYERRVRMLYACSLLLVVGAAVIISESSGYHAGRTAAIFTYLRSVGRTSDISFGKHDQSIEIRKWSDHIAL